MSATAYETEAIRAYAIAHFTQKYGVQLNQSAHVRVAVSPIERHVVCWRDTDYGEVPFFEKLHEGELIEHHGNTIQVNFDVFNAVGHILSGHMEGLTPEEKKQVARIPYVDIYEDILYGAVKEAARINGREFHPTPFWPEGKKFALCLTHDIDEVKKTYQYLTHPIIHLKRGEVRRAVHHLKSLVSDKARGRNPYWTFENMMALEESLGVRSTSYFLQEEGKFQLHKPVSLMLSARKYRFDDKRISAIMRSMNASGFEIGLHGSYHSYLSADTLKREKGDLEAALGRPVKGIRQHYLNLKIPETWEYDAGIGLEYDSSLGFKNDMGVRWGTCFPFHPLDNRTGKALSILELPLTIMDTPLFTRKGDLWKDVAGLVKTVENRGGLLTVLFHNLVFNEGDYPGWTQTYKKIIGLCKEKGAWIATAGEINDWWRRR